MLSLYPSIKPYETHRVQVDDTHNLYVEECGNSHGVPILYIHGGPGSGVGPDKRRFFDPEKYRIVLYDQRGCGKSTPFGELDGNNSKNLISDIEAIRKYLKVDKFILFGDSWGGALALLYSQKYPDNVSGIILHGIVLARRKDVNWLYKDGAPRIFPESWPDLTKHVKDNENLVEEYYKIFTGKDEIAKMAASKAWSKWEAICSTLEPSKSTVSSFTKPHKAIAMATISCHFFLNDPVFKKKNTILDNMEKINHIPGIMVHGRYDLVCPLDSAFELQRSWKNSRLDIVREAGHSIFEPASIDALIRATHEFTKNYI